MCDTSRGAGLVCVHVHVDLDPLEAAAQTPSRSIQPQSGRGVAVPGW